MQLISRATANNWSRLQSDADHKLMKRANKTRSVKRIVASGYLNSPQAECLLHQLYAVEYPIESIIYTLVVSALSYHGLIHKPHVVKFLSNYEHLGLAVIDLPDGLWNTEEDVLGFIYQSLMPEGERILGGQYYTSRQVVEYIIGKKKLHYNETFLDPCCGSGAFLMGITTDNPSNLYGFDINPIAVMIASTNLLLKYRDYVFSPNIYCKDYLSHDIFDDAVIADLPSKYDNIYTNPPWGSDKCGLYASHYPYAKSKERASMFFYESVARLTPTGTLYFLLPTSLLKINTHSDIRKYLLTNTLISQIDLYKGRFDGVFTDYFSIKVTPGIPIGQHYLVTSDEGSFPVALTKHQQAEGIIVIDNFSEIDNSILGKMDALCNDRLSHSLWALGIVTGDNKKLVKKEKTTGLESVYLGKDVMPFQLHQATSFIHFDPQAFQQCAKEELFRAPEKLIYRFIARYPIVVYDDRQCLCLNSANILIPQLDSISVKSVAALLNSTLYKYYYLSKFADIKVLKGNLQQLPFPKLTPAQDLNLQSFVMDMKNGSFDGKELARLDKMVYEIFDISASEQEHIYNKVNK